MAIGIRDTMTEAAAVGVGSATRDYRRSLMDGLMDGEHLDALAFLTPDYIKFASNFSVDVAAFERPSICVVPRDGEPFVVLHELSTNHWRFQTGEERLWVSDASFYSEHPRVRSRLPLAMQWSEVVAAKLEERGLSRARIGTDGSMLSGVAQRLGHLCVEDVEKRCQRLRWVKCEEEIVLMRQAAALSDWAQERYREEIRPGRLVAELDSTVTALVAEEAGRRMPGADVQCVCWTLSGPVSASPHGVGTNSAQLAGARVEAGHVLVNCVCPAIDGLFVENERTWFCGKPSQRQIELFQVARAATEAGCAAAVAGEPIWAIDAAAQDVIERAGLAELICHRTGHGLGLGEHDFPTDTAFNDSPLLEGMVFSVEPGLYEYGLGGFRHDDTVLVGSQPEILTTTPKDLAAQTIV